MSVLQLKQEISRLNQRERQELHLYLIRLKHRTPEWKRSAAKRIRDMQSGKSVSIEQLEARIARA